ELMTRAQTINLVLQDTQALRDQIASGEAVALGQSLTALGLRARSIGGVPLGVQLQLDSATDLVVTPEEALQDLDQFIASLQQQTERLRGEIAEVGNTIIANEPAADSNLTTEQIASYYTQLKELQVEQEQLQGQLQALTQERDVALETLQIIGRKRAERMIAEIQPSTEVRLASEAVEPGVAVRRGTLIKAFLGAVTGSVLGTLFALLLTILSPRIQIWRRLRPKQAADRPSYS
ncbi:MAG: hypothetical protein ACRDIB_06610, partial [Ardenticatenaceae bacterium]